MNFFELGAETELLRWKLLSTTETLEKLRCVRLLGLGEPMVYAKASLSLERDISIDSLWPAQRYILTTTIASIATLAVLFALEGIDIFFLDGMLLFWLKKSDKEIGPIPFGPPVIEESYESGNRRLWLIGDGMHRISLARRLGRSSVNILLVRHIPQQWPYYALPLAGGWLDVKELHSLPDYYCKRIYRMPEEKRALFRDFNSIFPGIQIKREKGSVVA